MWIFVQNVNPPITPGMLNTSIAIYQLISKVLWVDHVTLTPKHLSSSKKTLRPPDVPSWLGACINKNERRKGMGRRGPWKILTFSYQIFSEKVVFLVSSGKKFHHFWPPREKSFASLEKLLLPALDNIFRPPCTQHLINY